VRTGVDVPIATPHCQNATGRFRRCTRQENVNATWFWPCIDGIGPRGKRIRTLAADNMAALLQLDDNPTSADNGPDGWRLTRHQFPARPSMRAASCAYSRFSGSSATSLFA
jgi:hypothetical protein